MKGLKLKSGAGVARLPSGEKVLNELVFDAQNHHLTGTTPAEQFQIQQFSSADPFFNPSVAFFTEPPPYRAPPSALGNSEIQAGDSGFGNGNSESIGSTFPELPTYHTHSAKFPIVKEVIFSASSASQPPNLNKGTAGGPNQQSRIPIWSPGEAKRTGQLGWPEDRRAFTLDSRSAKELQDKFQTGSQRIVAQQRRNSLDLEKFIQVFNEEQALLASMQQGRQLEGGIDNPALDVGHSSHHQSQSSSQLQTQNMYNGGSSGKMSGYFPDSSNSSQSQSLSSSNTDSLDTVIYKGPSAQPGAGSIRDWQHRSSAESNPEISLDFNHRSENNSHRDTSNHMAYQMQQQQHQYQHSPHFNGNGYGMDYRSTQSQQQQQYQQQMLQQQQQHQHQGLSVQSLQHTHQNGVHNPNNSNGLPMNSSGMNMMRASGGGNVNPGYIGSNPQLSTAKSPTVTQKQFSTSNGGDPLSLDKAKESNKQFPAKTYNHIKDMISSRFGNVGSGNSNAAPNNHSMSYNNSNGLTNGGGNLNAQIPNLNGQVNSPTVYSAHNGDLSLGLPNSSYGLHHHSQNSPVNTSMSNYYNGGSPATVAYYGQPSPNNGTTPNGYRNDTTAADRKNVNTSFRKAIQKSTQKSNLVEESVQLRTISEVQAQNQANNQLHRPQPIQQQYSPGEQTGILAARAQKALDKLCESSKQQQYTLGSNLAHQQQHIMNGDTVKQPTQSPPPYPEKAPPPIPPNSLRITDFSLKSSLSPAKPPSTNHPKHTADPNSWNPDQDQPPPLPMSQKPQSTNSAPLGLPSPLVSSAVRENGDGSSGNADVSKCLSEAAMLKSEKLKQMSTEMHNLALSVASASEHHQSSSSDGEIKGSQRVGSGQSHTTTDSGHGTVLLTKSPQHSGDTSEHTPLDGLIGLRHKFGDNIADSISSGNDSEWVDIVEPEIRQILELERASKSTAGKPSTRTPTNSNSQQSQQHLSLNQQQSQVQGSSGLGSSEPRASSPVAHSSRQHVLQPSPSPKLPKKFDLNVYNKKSSQEAEPGQDTPSTSKTKTPRVPANLLRSNSGSGQRPHPWNARSRLTNDKGKSTTVGRKELLLSQTKAGKLTRNAMSQILYSLHDDNGDMTSTTTGLDLESMLDGPTENTSDDDDLSTTIDTTDAHAIRRQLESLESMYTEVLKVLGAKKFGAGGRYPASDLRNAKRRPYGSMSSLPSSVSSRPFRDNKKKIDDKKKVKDIKSINRRFQRLESHVVTLARSVAHLSSEMRTQHLMVQEMESIRNELSQLRSLTMKAQNQSAASAAVAAAAAANGQNFTGRGQNNGRQGGGAQAVNSTDWTSFRNALPSLTNPCRVRKLTKFFGDEPPLIRIFLKKLGYEKYASHFEQERIGIMELPYLTEERLQKMGIPMGPRLRILQEAHLCLKPGTQFPPDHPIHNGHGNTGNLSVYVV